LLLLLLTRFAGQLFLFSCVMVVRFGHEGFLVDVYRILLHNWRVGATKRGTLITGHWGGGALSSPHRGTTPRELPFEGDDLIAQRSVRGFLITQALGEIERNDPEKPEQSDRYALPRGPCGGLWPSGGRDCRSGPVSLPAYARRHSAEQRMAGGC
jgi:hypothetical protein